MEKRKQSEDSSVQEKMFVSMPMCTSRDDGGGSRIYIAGEGEKE